MNVVKRRWPDLLIGLLVVLLLVGFAALLLGKGRQDTGQSAVVQPAATGQQGTPQAEGMQPSSTPKTQVPDVQAPDVQAPDVQAPDVQAPDTQAPAVVQNSTSPSAQASAIPTIPSAPLTSPDAIPGAPSKPATAPATAAQPATTDTPSAVAPQAGGAVSVSAVRVPTRNDYRISLGSYVDNAAVHSATAGVNSLGYTVYPIDVARGVVAQVGPFATRETAIKALADIQRALPGALLYPPRNVPASDAGNPGSSAGGSSSAQVSGTSPSGTATPATSLASGSALAASGPVYLQVGAYKSVKAAQTAVSRVRDLGLEPSVNAPEGKLVTVVVGPYQGQSLTDAEAKLQSGGINSFRVR